MKDPMKVGKPGVNYYTLLGVPSTASQEEITKAFRKKILQVHLDKMGPEDDTELCYLTIEAHRILSDKALRQKYDVERSSSKDYKAQEEKFIPAGYICYDVGHQQMSRQLLDNISSWKSEYDKCASELSDNYFKCFSQIMAQVAGDNHEDGNDSNEKLIHSKLQQSIHYYCPVCDKNYVTETHHWDAIINPYRAMFFSDQYGIAALNAYFQGLIGQNMFEWELRYLPTRLLGIWGATEWSMITKLHQQAENILKQCDASDNPICYLESILESSSSKNNNMSFTSAQRAFMRRSLIQNLIWVMENRDQTVEQMMSRMNELIMQDDIQEIICLGVAMRSVLKFQSSEWEQLIQDALSQEQFELAMLWTMLAVESGAKSKGDWFQFGMTIRGMGDAVLAHFCFLLAGYESPNAWEDLADLFTENGAHHAAIEYHLNRGNLFQLLNKATALKKVEPDSAALYAGIYYATRVKGLLQELRKRPQQCFSDTMPNEAYNAEMEELIEIIQDLGGNPLEGFRIIVSTWPDVFEETPGYWIHRATIQYLRKGRINLKSQKLVLAAVHFLPEDEAFEEICQVGKEASQLTRSLLERAQETNDFEMLTDVLLHLNKRTLPVVEEYLEEVRPRPPPPPPNNTDEEGNNEEEETELNKEDVSPPQAPEPSHKSAIYLLLCGTVHKINERWLDAMKDYQNALLTAPEVLHRVLPCVSKLVQDIQFHEAVVAQVNQEIQDLQASLQKREYPNVDEFSSDKRRSLILTDVAPIMDYGYKDSVSKIQTDPDKMPPPPPPEEEPMDAPPPPPANTPMVTLDRNQEAIRSGQQDGQMDQLSAALAYVDLLKALPLPMHPGPIVMAASHFLGAMDDNTKPEDIGKLYAYRNAIMMMAENLLRVDKKLQHTIHHGLTHKHMLSILLSAHEKLSKALAKKNDNNNDASKNEDGSSSFTLPTPRSPDEPVTDKVNGDREAKENNACKSSKKDLIRETEACVISKLFQNVVNFPKVEPLASIPTLNCSDLVYVETLGNSFLSQFCADKVRQKHQSPLIPKHLHAYTHFVEVWKGRSTLSDFPQARVKAMEELLALNGWTMGDVQRKMMWPFIPIQSDGFSPMIECLLKLRDPLRSYRSIDGFQINYETGSVELLMSRDTLYPADTVFDLHDVQDIVSLSKVGLDRLVLSLETPIGGGSLSSHPFKEARFTMAGQSSKAYGQQSQHKITSQIPEFVMATLSRVSMLLCYLASGLEMCSEIPFWMRRTDEGLLARLDEHLQHLARPVSWRKAERRENNEKSPFENETMGKFWLNMIEVFEEIEDEEEGQHENSDDDPLSIVPSRQLTYRVGQMRTEIRPNTLIMTVDPKRGKQRLSPEAEFCRDLTRHFHEFSRAFPEFKRLEELVKISIVCSKLKQVLKENKALIKEFHSKNNQSSPSSSSEHSNKKIRAVSRVCSVIESFLTLQSSEQKENSSCNWFPATFCHNMDPDVYDVTVALELDPVVTYGPVPVSSKPIKVPLEKIISLGGRTFEFDSEADEIEKRKSTAVIHSKSSLGNVNNHNEHSEESDNEDLADAECTCGEVDEENDGNINNRTLMAVPEESEDEEESVEDGISEEDDDEMYEASFASIRGDEDEMSGYDNQKSLLEEEEIVSEEEDDDDDAVADGTENSESDRGSQCDEMDADDASEAEDEAIADDEKQLIDSYSDSDEEVNLKDNIAHAEEEDLVLEQEEEEKVPTLTIVLKRSSIISQTEFDWGDLERVGKQNQGESESNENDPVEGEYSDNDAESAASKTSSDEANQENVSVSKDEEEDDECNGFPHEKDSDANLMDDDNKNDGEEKLTIISRNRLSESEEDYSDEAGFHSEQENGVDNEMGEDFEEENGDKKGLVESKDETISSYEEEEMEESECSKDDLYEASVSGEEIEGCLGDKDHIMDRESYTHGHAESPDENSETESDSESDLQNADIQVTTRENKQGNSPSPTNNSLLIEGKSAVKLRKVNVDASATHGANQTKRSFLTRRGRFMVKLESEKVIENIVSESLEKIETDSDEGELIIAES